MKKLTAIITGALTVLAISATAFAANLISADEARALRKSKFQQVVLTCILKQNCKNCNHIMK